MRRCGLLLLCAAVVGCGWHVRGSVPEDSARLDGQELHLSSRTGTGELYREVRDALEGAGARLVSSGPGVPTLILSDERTGTRAITGGRRALVRETELRYEMDWELRDADGERLGNRETFEQVRYYTAEQERELASRVRRDQVVLELRRDVAQMLATQAGTRLSRER
nr:LPS assembly lipoprotein LptE [Methylonatrum kenyense]